MGKSLLQERLEAAVLPGADARESGTSGTRVRTRSGRATVTDGPFTETKEFLGGSASFARGGRSRSSQDSLKMEHVCRQHS